MTKKQRRVMKEFVIHEISLVDNPAQPDARVAVIKRADDELVEKNRRALTTMTAGHAHSITLMTGDADLKAGQTSWVDDGNGQGHTHDWVMDDAGNIILADAHGHTHGLAVLVKSDDLPEAGELASLLSEGVAEPSRDPDNSNPEAGDGVTKDQNMTDQEKAELEQKLADLQKSNDRNAAIVALSPEQRAHFNGLSGDEAEAFLAKSSEERDAVIKNAANSNPVIFKSADGTEYRQDDDPRLVQMAKDRDADRAETARLNAVAKQADLEKRAGDVLKNMGGEITTKAALLGAVDGIKDEALRGKVTEMLTAHDAGLGKAFERVGTTEGAPEGSTPADELDDLAKAYASEHKVDFTEAYTQVLNTAKGQELYKRHTGR